MPTKLEESRLEFTFDDDWSVVRWDEQPLYREPNGFGSLSGTAAMDFVGVHPVAKVVLFELKNFASFHHDNREKISDAAWHEALAGKVRDTLAGAVWARGRAHDTGATGEILKSMVDAWGEKPKGIRVVLWIEDKPQLKAPAATALASGVRRYLQRWLNIGSVDVLSTASRPEALPTGVAVRVLPEE